MEHWKWYGLGAKSSGTTGSLHGSWGSGCSDVFAVGSFGTILHYGHGTERYVVTLPLSLRNAAR
jgi:hypothetical protein